MMNTHKYIGIIKANSRIIFFYCIVLKKFKNSHLSSSCNFLGVRTLYFFILSPFLLCLCGFYHLFTPFIYLFYLHFYFCFVGFYLFIYALFYLLLVGLHCIFLGLLFQRLSLHPHSSMSLPG